MSKFYSATTNSFYDDNIHETLPEDSKTITDAVYNQLFSDQAAGKTIQADSDGNPEAVNFVLTAPQLHAALVVSAQAALDKSDPKAWDTYRDALRAIVNGSDTTSVSLPTVPSYPAGT